MSTPEIVNRVCACILLGLRVAPIFTLAPPFTLIRTPRTFRVLFGLGISACLVAANPTLTWVTDLSIGHLIFIAIRELLLGLVFVLVFQMFFGLLYIAGRIVDIQAGFGLALLIDPSSRGQVPLVGTLFAYLAAFMFFALGGHQDILRFMQASLQAVPLGEGALHSDGLIRVTLLLGMLSISSFGVAGGIILTLFLTDLAIALLSRTVPQMNVLVLGFQIKTILLMVMLPLTFGASGALLARMSTITAEAIPGLL